MSISFTPEQEQYIQSKLQGGKYHSAAEIVSMAFQLLDDYERHNSELMSEIPVDVSSTSVDGQDSLVKLFGCVKTNIHDVADQHDHYIGESLYRDIHLAE
jgi:putative addiction module CopG family antidote